MLKAKWTLLHLEKPAWDHNNSNKLWTKLPWLLKRKVTIMMMKSWTAFQMTWLSIILIKLPRIMKKPVTELTLYKKSHTLKKMTFHKVTIQVERDSLLMKSHKTQISTIKIFSLTLNSNSKEERNGSSSTDCGLTSKMQKRRRWMIVRQRKSKNR